MHTSVQADLPMPEMLVTPRVAAARLGIGFAQGILLYLLYRAAKDYAWPASEPFLFAPLLLVAVAAPLILISSLGHLNRRQAMYWVALAAIVVAGLGWYDIWRTADLPAPRDPWLTKPAQAAVFPSSQLSVFLVIGFFIAHALVLAGVRDQRRLASYSSYFETAWKLAVQLAFSALFVGVTWLVLELGAQLFMLVKLSFLSDSIHKPWFAIPVTTFAFSCAMHLTDVRPAIVRGIRTLLLVLMSWILPVMTLLVGGFVLSLPFTGLAPLWATRHAAAVLLATDAAFVVLINAAWQNGEAGAAVARPVRASARIAALLLVPLTAIAIYALALRVLDHGWTDERIFAAACLLVASCYALGYAHGALRRGWLPTLSRINIMTAFVVLATLLLVFSPIADPARLSVNDQVARLLSGKVPAAKFDFAYLRFDGARYGREALARLDANTSGPDARLVHERIAAARRLRDPWERANPELPPVDVEQNIQVWPKGTRLPEGFVRAAKGNFGNSPSDPACLHLAGELCDAFLFDLNGDGISEIILIGMRLGAPTVMAENAQGQWQSVARLPVEITRCRAWRDALLAGNVRAVPRAMHDIEIAGQWMPVEMVDTAPKPCGKPR